MPGQNAVKQTVEVDAVAEIYARSLFELSRESGDVFAIESVLGELKAIIELSRSDADFNEFLHSRIIGIPDRRESLQRIFGEEKASDLVLRFLLVLNDKGRLGHLAGITRSFEEFYLNYLGRVEVNVISAEPMDEQLIESIRGQIASALNVDPIIKNSVDESLIGGLKLRIGDRLLDASVAAKLRQIRESLVESGADSIRSRFDQMLQE